MTDIPRSALILGLAGVLPFAWGVITYLHGPLGIWTTQTIGPRFAGPFVQLLYGSVILSFMSGVLWGFATRVDGRRAALAYALSVIPALWAFFAAGGGPVAASGNLIAGYLGLLLLDRQFWRWGLAPRWWMKLRILLTVLVVLCLSVTLLL